ncbi:polymorphic toxin type 44 domain-containing protein [Amycolatopsis taiwanensis]|uniref:polymorphic toxin type 44 domain-containing protein n=1 Tax=Amycolatopsis taiwanensis TaxID=342230 RepID=UPI003D7F3ACA
MPRRDLQAPSSAFPTSALHAAALAVWAWQVHGGGPWDHRGRLVDILRNNGTPKGFYFKIPGTNESLNYDFWPNLHYGYVGAAGGFTEQSCSAEPSPTMKIGSKQASRDPSRGAAVPATPEPHRPQRPEYHPSGDQGQPERLSPVIPGRRHIPHTRTLSTAVRWQVRTDRRR